MRSAGPEQELAGRDPAQRRQRRREGAHAGQSASRWLGAPGTECVGAVLFCPEVAKNRNTRTLLWQDFSRGGVQIRPAAAAIHDVDRLVSVIRGFKPSPNLPEIGLTALP